MLRNLSKIFVNASTVLIIEVKHLKNAQGTKYIDVKIKGTHI